MVIWRAPIEARLRSSPLWRADFIFPSIIYKMSSRHIIHSRVCSLSSDNIERESSVIIYLITVCPRDVFAIEVGVYVKLMLIDSSSVFAGFTLICVHFWGCLYIHMFVCGRWDKQIVYWRLKLAIKVINQYSIILIQCVVYIHVVTYFIKDWLS